VRELALHHNFINAQKKDSQDICFIPDGNFGKFIEKRTGITGTCGNVVDINGKTIGTHKGYYHYTIGQRRGLGVSSGENGEGGKRLYVTHKSQRDNTITLGPETALYSKTLFANELNLIACDKLERSLRVQIKTRYMQRESEAVITQIDADTIRADFDEPERAVTPGQAAVFYDGDVVIGGGTITRNSSSNIANKNE
jgi:tRNA-specific 2-thiouridylase